mmetsp:Transcript_10205/g.22644  ORF Transcript_10205/g.22644 Transcript_10205/m.22644 type:complete len:283 (-) Transcript_10205:2588-3436(-)
MALTAAAVGAVTNSTPRDQCIAVSGRCSGLLGAPRSTEANVCRCRCRPPSTSSCICRMLITLEPTSFTAIRSLSKSQRTVSAVCIAGPTATSCITSASPASPPSSKATAEAFALRTFLPPFSFSFCASTAAAAAAFSATIFFTQRALTSVRKTVTCAEGAGGSWARMASSVSSRSVITLTPVGSSAAGVRGGPASPPPGPPPGPPGPVLVASSAATAALRACAFSAISASASRLLSTLTASRGPPKRPEIRSGASWGVATALPSSIFISPGGSSSGTSATVV